MKRRLFVHGKPPPKGFDVPRLIHHGRWNGLTLTLTSPLSHHVVRRGRRNLLPHAAITLEVAARGGIDSGAASGDGSVDEIAAPPPRVTGSFQPGDHACFGSDGRAMWRRAIHPRFVAWGLGAMEPRAFAWRSGYLGLGTVGGSHSARFRRRPFPVRTRAQGWRSARSSGWARAPPIGAALSVAGIPAHQGRLIRDLYLIERMVRVEEGRAAGVPVQERLTSSLLDVLGREGES